MSQPDEDGKRTRRDWLIDEALSQALYLALVVGVSVALAKRDWIARQRIRLRNLAAHDKRKWRERQAVMELRADLSAMEHADSWDGD